MVCCVGLPGKTDEIRHFAQLYAAHRVLRRTPISGPRNGLSVATDNRNPAEILVSDVRRDRQYLVACVFWQSHEVNFAVRAVAVMKLGAVSG